MKEVKIKLFRFTLLFQSKLVLLAVVVMMLAAAVWGFTLFVSTCSLQWCAQ